MGKIQLLVQVLLFYRRSDVKDLRVVPIMAAVGLLASPDGRVLELLLAVHQVEPHGADLGGHAGEVDRDCAAANDLETLRDLVPLQGPLLFGGQGGKGRAWI